MFIILTSPRTGSELLTAALAVHPNLTVESELLNPKRHQKLRELYSINELPPSNAQNEQIVSFVRSIFTTFDGFKIVYEQIDRNSPVVDLLVSLESLKIIFLSRNYLESAISYWFAAHTNIWQCKIGERVNDKPALIDPKFVEEFCQDAFENNCYYKSLFRNHYSLTINYNDLIDQWHSTTNKIQAFLGVPILSLEKPLDRRLTRPLCELVLNWSDLCNTKWHSLC